MLCELCNSEMYQGKLGEKLWICTNSDCERSDPLWLNSKEKEIKCRIEAINQKISDLSSFNGGSIRMYASRWVGEGSFDVRFDSGEEVQCHIIDGIVNPDNDKITSEMQNRFFKLI
ncbi:hypothetical protein [Paenibacillus sp. Aloe-11]|uniref:hypothetical protein n=1 Tax=Paenibacillus sp. Aloe-11 TaxID=1050222 RepID=UPI000694629B|nr:hypothetical protein [Paenibacillus sp. Aloe-11]